MSWVVLVGSAVGDGGGVGRLGVGSPAACAAVCWETAAGALARGAVDSATRVAGSPIGPGWLGVVDDKPARLAVGGAPWLGELEDAGVEDSDLAGAAGAGASAPRGVALGPAAAEFALLVECAAGCVVAVAAAFGSETTAFAVLSPIAALRSWPDIPVDVDSTRPL